MGLGAGGTWQICCVCSDRPCPYSKVHAGNVLSLWFWVADSAFTARLSPSSSSCRAEHYPWWLGRTVSPSRTDRNLARAGFPFLNHVASVGWAQSLALRCLLLLCYQEKPQSYDACKNCHSLNLCCPLAGFDCFYHQCQISPEASAALTIRTWTTGIIEEAACIMLCPCPRLLNTVLSRAVEGAWVRLSPCKMSARLPPLICTQRWILSQQPTG